MKRLGLLVVALLFLTACAHAPVTPAVPNSPAATMRALRSAVAGTKIKHIVFIIQENRTFDSIFGGKDPFPGADAASYGYSHDGNKIKLTEVPLEKPSCPIGWFSCADPNNYHPQWLLACNAPNPPPFPVGQPSPCRMNGFDLNAKPQKGFPVPVGVDDSVIYSYVNRTEVQPYWALANYYALGDHFFMGHNSESYTAHQYLFMGQSHNTVDAPQFDLPNLGGGYCDAYYVYCAYTPWGCDSPSGTRMYTIDANGAENPTPSKFPKSGPAPCFGGSGYTSLAEAAQSKGLSWRVYLWSMCSGIDALDANSNIRHNADLWPQNIPMQNCHLRYGPETTGEVNTKHFRTPSNEFFDDELPYAGHPGRSLASITWIMPGPYNSDHPGISGGYCGPTWVSSIVDAIGSKPDWDSTVIFILWDDWGGFYDHVPPYVVRDQQGPGFRVPLIVVSPYIKRAGMIVKTPTEFATLLKFAETTFNLPSLNATDTTPYLNDLDGYFDFTHPPYKFTNIAAPYTTRCYWSAHGNIAGRKERGPGPGSDQSRWLRIINDVQD